VIESWAQADGGGRWTKLVQRAVVLLGTVAALIERLLSRRGLSVGVLLVVTLSAGLGWIRPPIGRDISSFRIPLFGDASPDAAVALVYGTRPLVIFGVGTLIVVTGVAGAVLTWLNPRRFPLTAGLLLCALTAGFGAVLFNHPHVVEELDRQNQQCAALVTVLQQTVKPELKITYQPRVASRSLASPQGGLFDMLTYLPTEQVFFLLLALAAVAFARAGPLLRRLARLAVWSLVASVVTVGVVSARGSAERAWLQALAAERRGDVESAQQRLAAALERFPAFRGMLTSWEFAGRLDVRVRRETPAARLFRALQWQRAGEEMRAVTELEALDRESLPVPQVRRWLADACAAHAASLAGQEHHDGAVEFWEQALRIDPVQTHLQLCVAALRAPVARRDPDALAARVDPLLSTVANRALRAALAAMLGDCYFEGERFVEARARYAQSLRMYSLPKQINYRALRGLLGM
jgi:hypothetical protein